MRTVKASIEIEASPQEIFPFLVDSQLLLRWGPGVVTVEGSLTDVGSTATSILKLGRRYSCTTTVLEIDPPHNLVTEEDTLGSRLLQRFDLTERPHGTQVTVESRYLEMSVGQRLTNFLLPSAREALARLSLERLKSAVERPDSVLEPVKKVPARLSAGAWILIVLIFGPLGFAIGRLFLS